MTHCISILRGINVGGKRKILMADLKALYSSLGLEEIQTYIQSGNVIFRADTSDTTELAQKISGAIKTKFGFEVPVIVRTAEEMQNTVLANPYLSDEQADTEKLHLTFLSATPDSAKTENVMSFDADPDQCRIIDKDVYIYCEGKYHKTKLSNNFLEKKLQVTATTRNWKTVKKLVEMINE